MDVRIEYKAGNKLGESPFWSKAEESLYWVDMINCSLNRFTPQNLKFKAWHFNDLTCGVVPISNGCLCVALQHEVVIFDTKTNVTKKLFELERNIPDNRVNEMKCDPHGRLWIATMQNNTKKDGSIFPVIQNSGKLYFVNNTDGIVQMADDIGISNTLAWDNKRNLFYFADSLRDVIWRYKFSPDTGIITDRCEYFSGLNCGVPDGSTIDRDGFIWNTRFGAGCIVKISPEGRIVQRIDLPVTNPTSCCFGGRDNSVLYVTSARATLSDEQLERNPNEGSILAIQTDTQGYDTNLWSL